VVLLETLLHSLFLLSSHTGLALLLHQNMLPPTGIKGTAQGIESNDIVIESSGN